MNYAAIARELMGDTASVRFRDAESFLAGISRLNSSSDLAFAVAKAAKASKAGKIDGRQLRAVAQSDGDVAVLPLFGMILNRASAIEALYHKYGMAISTERFLWMFQAALDNPNIKAIVIDVNSPGGTSAGVHELAQAIFAARGKKPIIAHVNSMACSAAYWIAAAADELVAAPSSYVGSIGAYILHVDWSKNLEMQGIKPTFIFAGEHKVDGNPYEPLSEDAQISLQKIVDTTYQTFTDDVAAFRGTKGADVRAGYGQGDVVNASEAVTLGMADRVATLGETLDRLGIGKQAQQRKSAAAHVDRTREIEVLSLSN